MPSLTVSALQQTSIGSSTAEYAFSVGGKTVATFKIVNDGLGWKYDGYTACESFVRKYFRVAS
jgi:hypothetical protein